MEEVAAVAIWVGLILAYWAPTLVAALRGHRQMGPILVINLLLGWTFVGWVVALAMALSSQGPRHVETAPRGYVWEGNRAVTPIDWSSGYPSAHPAYTQPPQLPHALPYPGDDNDSHLREKPIP